MKRQPPEPPNGPGIPVRKGGEDVNCDAGVSKVPFTVQPFTVQPGTVTAAGGQVTVGGCTPGSRFEWAVRHPGGNPFTGGIVVDVDEDAADRLADPAETPDRAHPGIGHRTSSSLEGNGNRSTPAGTVRSPRRCARAGPA